jgi:uncharacterized membrane protein YwaF
LVLYGINSVFCINHIKGGNGAKLAVKSLICAAATILVMGAYLFFAGRFIGTTYSNWLFMGAMAYIGMGGFLPLPL